MPLAPGDVDRVNSPTLIGATAIAGHPPAQPTDCLNRWQVHHRRDEALGVTAPCPTTGNGTATILANRPVVAAHEKAPTGEENILKRGSAVRAELQHAAVVAEMWVRVRRFKVEVLPKG